MFHDLELDKWGEKNESVDLNTYINNLVVKASAWKCLHIKPVSKVFQIR